MSKKKQPEQAETEQTEAKQASEEKSEQPAEAKTPAADWEAKYNDLNDRYLRMAAEYDNFRKRSQREREQAYTDAVSRAVTALLPTYDNLERALKAETADTEYKKGVEMTMTQLVESLKGINVAVIDAAAGTAFDPEFPQRSDARGGRVARRKRHRGNLPAGLPDRRQGHPSRDGQSRKLSVKSSERREENFTSHSEISTRYKIVN